MESHPLERLIALIEFDQQIIAKERALTQAQHELAELQQTRAHLDTDTQQTEHKLHEAKKTVHECELTMQELDTAEKEKKELLETSPDAKVHQALRKEISHLKQQQYEHEKLLVQAWQDLETAQKSLDEQSAKTTQQITVVDEQLTQKTALIQAAEQELGTMRHERADKEAHVPQEWLDKYKMMRAHAANPIVPVVHGDCCGGCFAQLPPQDLSNLKRKQLLQCPSCYRFLYWDEKQGA